MRSTSYFSYLGPGGYFLFTRSPGHGNIIELWDCHSVHCIISFEYDHIYLQLKAGGLGLVVVEAELTSR